MDHSFKSSLGEISNLLSGFMTGDFKQMGKVQDENLSELVEKVNEVSAFLKAQAKSKTPVPVESEKFLEALLEASPSAIFTKDLSGKYTKCNKAFADMLGVKNPDDVIGKTVFDFYPQEVAQRITLGHERNVSQKITTTMEVSQDSKAGERWKSGVIFPMIDETGKVYSLGGIVSDIHESKIAKDRYQALFGAVDEHAIVAITDRNGKIIHANDNFCKITGYTKEELIGKDHRIINSGYHPKEFFEKMWNQLSKGSSWQGEICNKRKDGTHYWVSSTLAPYKTGATGTDGFIAIRLDITAQKEAQRKLVQSSKMSSLGEMAGGIAHEINNPVAIIAGKAGNIKRQIQAGKIDNEKICEGLDRIEATAERIAKIVKGLRSFSRNTDGDPMEKVKMSQIIDDTLELCRERFKNHSIDLRIVCDPEIEIECRPAEMCQVLINLLGNAHDAVETLTERWVEVNATVKNGTLTLSVVDSGSGISNEVSDKIMDPFFTTKPVGKGTGLGLSISKGIAEDHKGRIYYKASSKNTCFVLELPLTQSSQSAKKAA